MKFRLPALAATTLLATFLVAEGRLRQGDEARSLDAGETDQSTTRDVGTAFVIAAVGAPALSPLPIGRISTTSAWLGVGVMAGGLSLRFWSARVLGTHYTRTLRVGDAQPVVESGPYAQIRHPGYAGALAMWIGFGLAWGSMLSFAATTLPMFIAYQRRMEAEEDMLNASLGTAYLSYSDRTARLIPGVY